MIVLRFSTLADWIRSNPAYRSRTHAARSAQWTGVGASRYLTTACGKRFLGLEVDAGDGAVLRDGSAPTCEVCLAALAKRREQIIDAEANAARHLGNYNEHREAGRLALAERSFWSAQKWLDRANDLRGMGAADAIP